MATTKPLTNDPEWARAALSARHKDGRAYYPDVLEEESMLPDKCFQPSDPPRVPKPPALPRLQMTLDAYQAQAEITAAYPSEQKILYPTFGLAEEAGEVAGKIKRWLRGDGDLKKDEVVSELGDVLWYVAVLAGDLGVNLETVAQRNLAKLRQRKAKNTIKGAGDDR